MFFGVWIKTRSKKSISTSYATLLSCVLTSANNKWDIPWYSTREHRYNYLIYKTHNEWRGAYTWHTLGRVDCNWLYFLWQGIKLNIQQLECDLNVTTPSRKYCPMLPTQLTNHSAGFGSSCLQAGCHANFLYQSRLHIYIGFVH